MDDVEIEDLEKAGLTEITGTDVDRLDGVFGPANGTGVLLMKSLADEPVSKAITHAHAHWHGDEVHNHLHTHTGSGDQHGGGDKFPHQHGHTAGQEFTAEGEVQPTPVAKAVCPTCGGTGTIMDGHRECPDCDGPVEKALIRHHLEQLELLTTDSTEALAPVQKALEAITERLTGRASLKEATMTEETKEPTGDDVAKATQGVGEPGIPAASGQGVDNIISATGARSSEESREDEKTTGNEDVPATTEQPPDSRGDEGKDLDQRPPAGSMQGGADGLKAEEALEDKKTTGHEDVPAVTEQPDQSPEHTTIPIVQKTDSALQGVAKSAEPAPIDWAEVAKSAGFTEVIKSVVSSDEFGAVLKAQLAPIIEDQVKAAVAPLEDRVKVVEDQPARPQPLLRGRADNGFDHLVVRKSEAQAVPLTGATAEELAKALDDIKDPVMRDKLGQALAESAHPFGASNRA